MLAGDEREGGGEGGFNPYECEGMEEQYKTLDMRT